MYSTHYRSYYEVHFGQIKPFETLRFSSNYFPLSCLSFASIALIFERGVKNKLFKMMAFCLVSCYLICIWIINYNTRSRLSKIEFDERISPIKETLKFTNTNDFILTDIACVFHIFLTDERSIIYSYSTTGDRIESLLNDKGKGEIYFLKRISDEFDRVRYPEYFEKIVNLKVTKVRDISFNYELLKLTNK